MALRISQGSGATLASNILNGEHLQIISPVSLYPLPAGTNFIGLTSVQGNVNVTNASFPVTQSGTWNVGLNGLVSLPSGTEIKATATINNWPSTQAVTQSGVWNVNTSTASITGLVGITGSVAVTGSFYQATQPVSIGHLISLASGTEVKSLATINNWPATQAVTQSGTWNVGLSAGTNNIGDVDVLSLPALPAGANHIGSVSIFGNVNTSVGAVTLNPGPAQIGSVTVSNFPATQAVSFNQLVSLASGTFVSLNAGTNHIGSVSIFGTVQSSSGNVTLNPGPNQIGSVTISNIPAVTQSGSWNVGINAGTNNIGDVDVLTLPALPAGSNHIGSVSIFGNINTTAGMVTLFPGPNQIGSVTISNIPAVTQSGTWNVGVTGLISLASGTFVSLNAGTTNIGDVDVLSIAAGDNNIGNVDVVTLPATPAGTNYIGLVSVSGNVNVLNASIPVTQSGTWTLGANSGTDIGDVTLTASTNYVGLASVNIGGTLPALSAGTNNIGDVDVLSIAAGDNNIGNVDIASIAAGANYIGLASVNIGGSLPAGANNIGDVDILSIAAGDNNIGNVDVVTLPATPAGTNYIGLASVNIGGTLPALTAGANFIGLASVVPAFTPVTSNYTSLATVISASGNATLFVPPASNRWVLKDLVIGAQGNTQVGIRSGTKDVIPPIALASLSGFISNFGESGFRAAALNDSFVVVNNSAATISVTANVRFDSV